MSSWMNSRSLPKKKQVFISNYHDASTSLDIISIYLDFLGAYIFNQKMGQVCNVWDPTGIINASLIYNPQVKFLKEKPEDSNAQNMDNYIATIYNIKYADIKRYAANIIQYDMEFNQTVIKVLEKASIKSSFNIGIHLLDNVPLPIYIEYIRTFQKKSKKEALTIYVMTASYELLKSFQAIADPKWKITSLAKNIPVDASDIFINMMAEIQVMSVIPALILDFNMPIDRFIYIMHRNMRDLEYFKELNNLEWSLHHPSMIKLPAPAPVPVPNRTPAPPPVHVVAPTPTPTPTPAPLPVPLPAAAAVPAGKLQPVIEANSDVALITIALREVAAARDEAAAARDEAAAARDEAAIAREEAAIALREASSAREELAVARRARVEDSKIATHAALTTQKLSVSSDSAIPIFDFGSK